jgi:ABC-type sugar transport system permease subunit/ABC-type glycerol-3-phosphate transport system substrate-binding protein
MNIVRFIRFLLGLVALAIVLWAFYDVGRRTVLQYQQDRARPITLTVLHWGDPAENNIVKTLCDRYTAQHSNVRIVDIQAVDIAPKLRTMLAAGTPPDLFYLPPTYLPSLAQLKVLHPIDEFLNEDKQAGHDIVKDYYPVLIKSFRYDTATSRNGEGPLYGLPKDFTPLLFYVNVDLFKAAGVPIPYHGWTWDEFEADMKKITALTGQPAFENRRIFGGVFELWDDTIRQIIWTFGGDYFGKNFRDVTLDSPQSQEALAMIYRTRLVDKDVYNATGIAKDGAEEFVNGNIGCDGPVGRWKVPRFAHDIKFKWDVVPCPHKAGLPETSLLAETAWSMTAGSPHPREAYDLMKFLCGPDGGVLQSQLGLAVPPMPVVANSPDFLSPAGIPPHNSQLFVDAIKYCHVQQVPVQTEWKDILENNTSSSIQLGQISTMESAQIVKRQWLQLLDAPILRHEWKPLPWVSVLCVVAALMATIVLFLWLKARREKLGLLDRAQERAGFSFISPWLVGFLVLTLGPMILSLILAFCQWTGMTSLSDARGVGLANFQQLFTDDPVFYKSLRVTVYYVVLAVPTGQIAALLIAMLMNMRVRGIAAFRTIYFVPSVVSGAVLAVMWIQIFNNDYGIFNKILAPFAHLFHTTPPDWFGTDIHRWGIPGFVIMSLWGVGGGMIIYLAGLKGIPASLYEAATVDGAGSLRKFWTITLPMLSPLIFYNVIMAIIGSFQVFTQAYMMTNPSPGNETLFYVWNLYHQAFEYHNMGYASAMAWILFVICLGLTLILFRGSRGLVYYEGLKT